jgi:hypothetical protein
MRVAIILAAVSATIVAAVDIGSIDPSDYANCKDPQGLLTCAQPELDAVQSCSTSDMDCLCAAATAGQKYAPPF